MSGERGRPDDPDAPGGFASPACLMHELDADGNVLECDAQQRIDVMRWRRAERRRQIELRLAMSPAERLERANLIAAHLEDAIGNVTGLTVSAYWPMRGEPDLRRLIERITDRGGRCALPVVGAHSEPLVFRSWAPGERLERGVWNILVPVAGAEVMPDVIIAPVVAFDRACYRLGNGGGYFDRTLAAITPRPRVLGVGYSIAEVPTIYPQPHDVPMDAIVTENGVLRVCADT